MNENNCKYIFRNLRSAAEQSVCRIGACLIEENNCKSMSVV